MSSANDSTPAAVVTRGGRFEHGDTDQFGAEEKIPWVDQGALVHRSGGGRLQLVVPAIEAAIGVAHLDDQARFQAALETPAGAE